MDREAARGYLGEIGVDLHARGTVIDGVGFMGLGGGTPSPFGTPWEIGDEEAERCLAAGFAQIADASFRVLVSHSPPRGTELDRGFDRKHLGSESVRKFLLGGSVGLLRLRSYPRIGGAGPCWARPTCLNVGPFKNGNYALVTIDGGRANVTRRTK